LDTILIMTGVGCIIGAIIGGGVKLVQIELAQVKSLWRQSMLGIFGAILIIWGLVSGGHLTFDAQPAVSPPLAENQTEASPPPKTPAATPYKVDIFWCVTDDGGAENQAITNRILPALEASPLVSRVRARLLTQATNAQAAYSIAANIVRYDPGEAPMAEQIARLASQASGTEFAPAHALPGSPSIDYLSIFVCAIH
jgi:hypothetical protein